MQHTHTVQNHVFSVLHRGANCIGRQWCVYCIRATCRGLRSLPPPSGEALPLPTPYCWIHIAHFPFTSILNNGPFLFKVLERQLPRFAIVYSGLPRWCSGVVIFFEIQFCTFLMADLMFNTMPYFPVELSDIMKGKLFGLFWNLLFCQP